MTRRTPSFASATSLPSPRALHRQAVRLARRGWFALRPLSVAAAFVTAGAAGTAQAVDCGVVVAGQVQCSQSGANTVFNQGSKNAIVQTPDFSIAANQRVTVNQPDATSAFMARITGWDATVINGALQSNGRVFLLNPNGIVFGSTAQVDVGSLVATTLSLTNEDFLAGRILLRHDPAAGQGDLKGRVINEGRISAPFGSIVLAGLDVTNSGVLAANGGRVGMVAAEKVLVDVEGDGLLFFEVEGGEAGVRLQQLGRIEANGGAAEIMAAARSQFADTVLNMDGVIQARSLGTKNGRVVIDGGSHGITSVSGSVDVSGQAAGETGGSIDVLGDKVALLGAARLDASGAAGGGRIRVGGDYQGSGDTRRAQATFVGSGVTLDASAREQGDGGRVIVWADGTTRFLGQIAATGGALGGNGGFAEVSGKSYLDYRGFADLSAAAGNLGTLLLDPRNIEIVASDPDLDGNGTPGDDLAAATFTANSGGAGSVSKITSGAVEAQLNTANVVLTADNVITVSDTIDASGNAGNFGLTLTAATIDLAADISTRNGLTLNATTGIVITGLGGNRALNAGTGLLALNGAVTGNAHNLALTSSNAAANAVTLGAVSATGALSVTGNASFTGAVGTTGSVAVSGTTALGANVTTTGTQTYSGATTVSGGARTLAGSTVTLAAVDGGAQDLTITGNAALNGAVTNVAALSISGTTALAANVTTTGTQTYTGATTVSGGARTLAGSTVTLAAVDGGTQDLTITGNAALNGAVTNVAALSVSGTTALAANVTTTGTQTYSGATTVSGGARTLTGSTVTLAAVDGGAQDLTITGNAALNGAVTNVAALSVSGTTALAANVTTTGTQTYTGATTVSGGARTLTGSTVTLAAVDGGTQNLTLTGNAELNGAVTNVAALSVSGTTALAADVTTTGTQTYSGATTVSGGARTLTGSTVTLAAMDGGTQDLTITGNAALNGAVTNVAALSISGTTALGANVTSTGKQTYSGAVTLGSSAVALDAGAAKIELAGAVNGNAQNLTLTSTHADADAIKTGSTLTNVAALDVQGNATIGGAVTGTDSVGVAGTTALNASVTTTGAQTYTGNATLGAAVTTRGSSVAFGGDLARGAHAYTVQADTISVAGSSTGSGAVTLAPLADASTIGVAGGAGTFQVAQALMDKFSEAASLTLGSATGTGAITFGDFTLTRELGVRSNTGAITFADLSGAHALSAQTTGTITLGGNVGVGSLSLTGPVTINTATVTTTGTQSYTGDVTLGTGTTLQAGAVNVTGNVAAGTHNLALYTDALNVTGSISGTGTATVAPTAAGTSIGVAGGAGGFQITQALINKFSTFGSLTLGRADGTGAINFGNFTLGRDLRVQSGTGNITFAQINGDIDGARDLTVVTSGGTVRFNGDVGTLARLDVLDVTAPVQINASSIFVAGAQNYRGATTLLTDTQLNGNYVRFYDTLDGARHLSISANVLAYFAEDVGSTTPLASVTIGGQTNTLGSMSATGSLSFDSVMLFADATFRAPSVTFSGNLFANSFQLGILSDSALSVGGTLNGSGTILIGPYTNSTTIGLNGGAGSLQIDSIFINQMLAAGFTGITIGSPTGTGEINVGSSGGAFALPADLTLVSQSGNIVIDTEIYGAHDLALHTGGTTFINSALGSSGALASFSTDAGGTTRLAGSVRTTGNQTYGDAVVLDGTSTLTASAGLVDFQDNVNAASAGAYSLNVSGPARFRGSVGNTTALSSVSVTGNTTFDGGTYRTTSIQSYAGAATLAGDASFTSNNSYVWFQSTLNGAHALTLTTSTGAYLWGMVGGTTALDSINVTAGLASVGDTVSSGVRTTGAQTYAGSVNLRNSLTLQGNTLSLNGGSQSASHALTLTDAGTTTLGGTVNAASLSTSGDTVINATSITTAGAQTYGGDVTLGASTTLSGNTIGFNGTVEGNHALTVNDAGTTTFAGNIGGADASTALTSLTTGTGGRTVLPGSVRTSGAQTYNDTVELAGNTALTAGSVSIAGLLGVGHALSVTTTGLTAFSGSLADLASLNVSGGGTTRFLGTGGLTTSGAQSYGGNVEATGNATFAASSLTFGGDVGGGSAGTLVDLGLTADSLSVAGGLSGTGTLTVQATSAGTTMGLSGGAGDLQLDLNDVSGFTQRVFGRTDGTGTLTVGDSTLTGHTTLRSGSGAINISGDVNGAYNLAIQSQGTTTFGGDIGATTALASLTTDAGGSTTVSGGTVRTSGAASFGDAVTYSGSASFESASLSFGAGIGGGTNLTLTTNNLSVTGGLAGSGVLTLQTASAATTIGLAGGAGTLQISQALLNQVSGFDSQVIGRSDGTGAITSGALVLGRDTTVRSTSAATHFTGTVEGSGAGGQDLAVATSGTTTFSGAVGAATALGNLATDAGGNTVIAGGSVRTSGLQSYGDAVTYTGSTTLQAAGVVFNGGATGTGNLTLTTDAFSAAAPVSGTGVLAIAPRTAGNSMGLAGTGGDLQIDAATLSRLTGFSQRIFGNALTGSIVAASMTLTTDTTLVSGSGNVTLGTIDGPYALTVNTAGITAFGGAIGGTTALASLTTDAAGSTQIHTSTLRTTGNQAYLDTVSAAGPLDIEAARLDMQQTTGNLTLNNVALSNGGSVHTPGTLTLQGNLTLTGGQLTLLAGAAGTPGGFTDPALAGTPWAYNSQGLREARAAIVQSGGAITTAAGTVLDLQAPNRGSILVDRTDGAGNPVNNIAGTVRAVSGPAGDAGLAHLPTVSMVRIASQQINAAGIEGDVVKLTAGSINTASGTTIRARLPYNNAEGVETSLPALTLVLTQPFASGQYGGSSPSSWIQVDVGNATGGYVTVRPKGIGAGATSVFLGGPESANPFYDGSGKISEIQVYYNGRTPSTPQEVGALSAVTSVIQEASRTQFEQAVRTENVSSRLRNGVVAEVGSGRPATEGSDSLRMPESCTPKAGGLSC